MSERLTLKKLDQSIEELSTRLNGRIEELGKHIDQLADGVEAEFDSQAAPLVDLRRWWPAVVAAVIAAGVLLLWPRSPSKPTVPSATAAEVLLAEICETYAAGIQADGDEKEPRLLTTRDVGETFNRIGKIACRGKSLKDQLPEWFERVGKRIKKELGIDDTALPLDDKLRRVTANIFQEEAKQLREVGQ